MPRPQTPEACNRATLESLTAVDAGRWPLRNPLSLSAAAILPPEPVPATGRSPQ